MSSESYTMNNGSSNSDPLEAYRKLKVSQGLPPGMISHEEAANFLATHYNFPLSDYSNPGQHSNLGHNRKQMVPLNPQMLAVSNENSHSEPYDSSIKGVMNPNEIGNCLDATGNQSEKESTSHANSLEACPPKEGAHNYLCLDATGNQSEQESSSFADSREARPPKQGPNAVLSEKYEDFTTRTNTTTTMYEKVEMVELPEDVFSMVYLAPWCSPAFCYALAVFFIQLFILLAALVDLIYDKPGEEDKNFLEAPPITTTYVLVAQFLALLVAVLAQDDITQSLHFISLGLANDCVGRVLRQRYPGAATSCQFFLANLLRLAEGCLTVLVSFVFIVQSESVLEIFLNFAAIEFVSELDNLGFRLAKEGWFGRNLQDLNRRIKGDQQIPVKKKKSCMDYFNQIFLFIIVATLFVGNVVVIYRQYRGHYIKTDACGVVDVKFGGEVYNLPTTAALRTTVVNGTMYLAGSTRPIPSGADPTVPPPLFYTAFSGKYHPDFQNKAGIRNQRPVYYEARKSKIPTGLPGDDSSRGFFYYCEEENAWVWTVRALLDAGIVPQKTVERCKYGWLLRSPITEAVRLEEVPTDNWRIWTGVLGVTSDLSFSCFECRTDIDCGLDRGTCGDDNVCDCYAYADGDFCNQDKACNGLVGFHNGQEIGPFVILDWTQTYDRPVYLWIESAENWVLLYFTGRRWTMKMGSAVQVWPTGSNADGHAYWYNGFVDLDFWYGYSEPTNNFLPTGPLQWYSPDKSSSQGDYGPLGRQIEIDFRLSCLPVNCDRSRRHTSGRVCGKFGKCQQDQILTVNGEVAINWFDDNKTFVGGKCICDEGYYGHFCEFENTTIVSNANDEL